MPHEPTLEDYQTLAVPGGYQTTLAVPRMGARAFVGQVRRGKKSAEHSAAEAFLSDPDIQRELAALPPPRRTKP